MSLGLTACIAFVLSAVLTRVSIPWLARFGALAGENDRTMHSGSIPQGAGAPLLIAAFVAATITGSVNPAFILAVLALAAVSLLNDRVHIPAVVRLAAHAFVSVSYVFAFPDGALVFQGLLPAVADRLLTAFALVWMMNLFNFMDGINGIAGTEAIAIAVGYLLVLAAIGGGMDEHSGIAAAIAGACAGFLLWNLRRRALVFLGDSGSVPLGFLTGALMVDLAVRGHWAAALILPSYFLADATLTLLVRVMRGERLWEAHRSHFYQRAARSLHSHLAVVARIAIANAALIGLAVWSLHAPWLALAAAAAVVVALLLQLNRAARAQSRFWDTDP